MLKGQRAPKRTDVPMVNKKWTPVDSFVTEYGFKRDKTFEYRPGSGIAIMKTYPYMDLDDLRALIKSVEHHELQISVEGTITVFVPEEPGEEPETPEDDDTLDYVDNCPECGGPATHPSGLCRDCHQAKLEHEEKPEEEIAEAVDPELEVPPEAQPLFESPIEEEKPPEELIPE